MPLVVLGIDLVLNDQNVPSDNDDSVWARAAISMRAAPTVAIQCNYPHAGDRELQKQVAIGKSSRDLLQVGNLILPGISLILIHGERMMRN
jgi:hypothetical protein